MVVTLLNIVMTIMSIVLLARVNIILWARFSLCVSVVSGGLKDLPELIALLVLGTLFLLISRVGVLVFSRLQLVRIDCTRKNKIK